MHRNEDMQTAHVAHAYSQHVLHVICCDCWPCSQRAQIAFLSMVTRMVTRKGQADVTHAPCTEAARQCWIITPPSSATTPLLLQLVSLCQPWCQSHRGAASQAMAPPPAHKTCYSNVVPSHRVLQPYKQSTPPRASNISRLKRSLKWPSGPGWLQSRNLTDT